MSGSVQRLLWIPILTILLLLMLDIVLIDRMKDAPVEQKNPFPAFRTKDLQGNTVTHDIFKGRFSVVCLWVTRDAADSRELLDAMSAWKSSSLKSFQIIGIIGDVRDTGNSERIDTARSILRGSTENIPHLLVNDEMGEFLKGIRNVPTTCFVDEHGNLIGQPVVGNEPALIQKEAHRLMEEDSPQKEWSRKIQERLFLLP